MTTQRREAKPVPAPTSISFGVGSSAVGFRADLVPLSYAQQNISSVLTGPQVQRGGRDGIQPLYMDDLSGGYVIDSKTHDWARDKNNYYFNEGIWGTWQAGIATLPYKLTSNASLNAVNHSGFRTANKRGHGVMFNNRFYFIAGPQLYKDTSTSDPTMIMPSTNDNITDIVTAASVGDVAGVQSLVIAGSTTDGIKYTTDPTANSISWTSMVTLSNTPYVNWVYWMPQLGPGAWVDAARHSSAGGSGIWHWPGSAALPATPKPTPLSATASETNTSNATITTADLPFSKAVSLITDATNQTGAWTTTSNALLSDNAYAQGISAVTTRSAWLALFGPLPNVPSDSDVTGGTIKIEHSEGNASYNVADVELFLCYGPGLNSGTVTTGSLTLIGVNLASATEWATSDATVSYTFGSEAGLTPAMINSGSFGIALTVKSDDANAAAAKVDYATINFTYRPKGTMLGQGSGATGGGVGLGGFGVQNPADPSVIYSVEPVTDDLTGITVRRILKKYTFSWDATNDRALVELSFPNLGDLNYVGLIIPYQGGLAVIGGSNSTLWNRVKLLDSNDQTRDLACPGFHGTNALTITRANVRGNFLIVDTAYTDGSEAQTWGYFNQHWYCMGVQQNKSSAIATEPLLWAESTVSLFQNYLYRFYPVSTTALACAYEFLPPDLFLDPNLANTSVTKQDGPLYVQGVILDVGAQEANKVVTALQCHSLRIDDKTLYGTVRVTANVVGDPTFAATGIDKTFSATTDLFTDQRVPDSSSTRDPGIAYRMLIFRFYGDNTHSSAKTPNLLPVEAIIVMQWPHYEILTFNLPARQDQNVLKIISRLKALTNTKGVQRLLGAWYDCPAQLLPQVKIIYRPGMGTDPPRPEDVQSAQISFRVTPGSTS